MAAAGFQPLSISGFPCALYYFNPTQTNSWLAAKAQADAVGGIPAAQAADHCA
jgi:hypothetical protein